MDVYVASRVSLLPTPRSVFPCGALSLSIASPKPRAPATAARSISRLSRTAPVGYRSHNLLYNGDREPRQLLAAHAVPAKRANQSSSTGRQRECRDSISLIVTTFRPHERTRRADLSSSVITPAAISACIKSRRKDALRYPHALRSGVRIPVL
jgi:hypothetical protein